MAAVELVVNGNKRRLETDAERSLPSVLRDDLELTGGKYGCGEGQCGAWTVLAPFGGGTAGSRTTPDLEGRVF